MNNIKTNTIQLYIKVLADRGVSVETIKRKLSSLVKFIEWLKETGRIDEKKYKDLISNVKTQRVKLTSEERLKSARTIEGDKSETTDFRSVTSDENVVADSLSRTLSGSGISRRKKHIKGVSGEFYFKFKIEFYKIRSLIF